MYDNMFIIVYAFNFIILERNAGYIILRLETRNKMVSLYINVHQ